MSVFVKPSSKRFESQSLGRGLLFTSHSFSQEIVALCLYLLIWGLLEYFLTAFGTQPPSSTQTLFVFKFSFSSYEYFLSSDWMGLIQD